MLYPLSYERWCPDSLRHAAPLLCSAEVIARGAHFVRRRDTSIQRGLADTGLRVSTARQRATRRRSGSMQYLAQCNTSCIITNRSYRLMSTSWCALLSRMSRGAMRRLGVMANLGEDNRRAAQPRGILLNVGTPTVPMGAMAPTPGSQEQAGGAKEPAEDTMKPAPHSGKTVDAGAPAPAEPSWGQVLATTIKLWVLRRLPFVGFAQQRVSGRQSRNWLRWRPAHLRQLTARRRRLASLVLALAVAAVAAVQFSSVFTGTASPAARAPSLAHPVAGNAGPVGTHGTSSAPAPAAQAEAAAWIADQVSSDAIVACYPVMCAALMAQGVTAGRLLPLRPGAANPVGASVLVISTSIRSQLTDEYAPALMASFGSGDTRIEVRAAEPPEDPQDLSCYETGVSNSPRETPRRSGRVRWIPGCWRRSRRWRPSTHFG